jgi:CheY-like chemotaxis protein
LWKNLKFSIIQDMQSERSDRSDLEIDASGFRLLVCDDSTAQREALAQILRGQGYEVDEAADGNAALTLIKSRSYDLLLLDLQMPVVDGFDVLIYVQRHRPQLPVVVLSGLPPEEIGDGLDRLPNHELPPLLLKPVDSRQLFQVIELKLAGELP